VVQYGRAGLVQYEEICRYQKNMRICSPRFVKVGVMTVPVTSELDQSGL
jgi:hypothetical protein